MRPMYDVYIYIIYVYISRNSLKIQFVNNQ